MHFRHPQRTVPDASSIFADNHISEAMESSTAKAYGIGFAELPKLEYIHITLYAFSWDIDPFPYCICPKPWLFKQ